MMPRVGTLWILKSLSDVLGAVANALRSPLTRYPSLGNCIISLPEQCQFFMYQIRFALNTHLNQMRYGMDEVESLK